MEAAGAAADGRDASARARQAAPGTCLLLVSAASPAAMGRAGLRPHPVSGQDGWRLLAREAEEALSSGTLAEVAAQVLAVPATEVAGHVRHAAGDFFFCRTNPLPKLVCVGGVHVSIHLTRMAKMLGYHTVVIDPRGAFATGERFPFVDQLVHAWPQEAFKGIALDESTALCALTHDPKIDVPALAAALDSPAFYIGSLGRHTTRLRVPPARVRRLRRRRHRARVRPHRAGPEGPRAGRDRARHHVRDNRRALRRVVPHGHHAAVGPPRGGREGRRALGPFGVSASPVLCWHDALQGQASAADVPGGRFDVRLR